jgi:hypothetical protein
MGSQGETYLDIQPWLTTPPDWRTGFIMRLRGRLKDRSFFSEKVAVRSTGARLKRR